MNRFLSMNFFRCIAWGITGCYALNTGVEIKSLALIIAGAFSVALGIVLFTVFEENAGKEKEAKARK